MTEEPDGRPGPAAEPPVEAGEAVWPDTIAQRAGRGLRWSFVAALAAKAGTFAMGLVLARLLAPADFGLFAVALAATGFVMHVNDVGLIAATVQWRGRLEDVAPTAATLSALFSVAVYVLFWVSAPAFAELAGNADAAPVVRLLTVVILVDGLTAIRVAALQRRFEQSKIAIANMAGIAVQVPVTIALAAGGAGAYGLALGQLTQAVITGIVVLAWARLPLRVHVDRAVAARLLRYGIPLAAGLGVEALLMNADFVVVGRILGATALGFYLLAFNISSWIANLLTTAIRYVSVAGFSRLSEQDGALSDGVLRAVPLLLTVVLPLTTVMGVLATPLIVFLYGQRWEPAAAALSFLMVLTVIRLLTGLSLDVLMGAGATRAAFWVNVGWAAALIPALVVGTRLDGIRGTAIGHVVAGLLVALPLSGLALWRAGVRVSAILPASVRPLLSAAVAGAVTFTVEHVVGDPPWLQLVAAGSVGVIVYGLLAVPGDARRSAMARLRSSGRARVASGTSPTS